MHNTAKISILAETILYADLQPEHCYLLYGIMLYLITIIFICSKQNSKIK